jgi:hypothetical protein
MKKSWEEKSNELNLVLEWHFEKNPITKERH